MMREMVLTAASLALTGAVVANAYYQKHQFYPSVVYLTKSSPSMAVLYLQAFVFVILLGKLIRKVFFGQLRAAEMEHLIERSWYAVTETCLAFTVFRDDFSPRFVAQFTMLLFIKCFHWLAEDRIDYMERSPVLTWLFHIRAISLLMFLGIVDSFLVHVAYNTTVNSGASVQLVFGFEYAILLTIVATVFMKYTLHVIDLQSENPWDNKAVYLLYTELIMGFIKAVLYICFVAIMIKVHTFPLFAIRPMYLTLRGFKKSLSDVIMSRRAISNMNTLYPDATPDELSQGDNVCIICREEMTTACKKLPCNHIFHASCLRSWFQRQQTCPTCRMDVLRTQPRAQVPPTQPPAGPQMPQAVPNGMPPFGMFPGWPPMGMPAPGPAVPGQPEVPGQTPSMPGAVTPTYSAQATQGMPGQMLGMPPFMMPPPFMMAPPMFGMPYMPPPPTSGVDTSSLSVEELRALEGQEKQNVEARIAMLRNIHMLLDVAIGQINQYTQMVNAQSQSTASSSEQSTVSTSGASAAKPDKPVSKPGQPVTKAADKVASEPPDWPSLTSANTQPSTVPSTEPPTASAAAAEEPESVGSSADSSGGGDTEASQELRRRRLERFTSREAGEQGTEEGSGSAV